MHGVFQRPVRSGEMESNKVEILRCNHIKANGTRCGSPALRNQRLCYFHHENHSVKISVPQTQGARGGEFVLPVIEDTGSVLVAVQRVTQLLLEGAIEPKIAGLALYGLQIASASLKQMREEKPEASEVVIDTETGETAPRNAWKPVGVKSAMVQDRIEDWLEAAKVLEKGVSTAETSRYLRDGEVLNQLAVLEEARAQFEKYIAEWRAAKAKEESLPPGTIQARAERRKYVV
jgi:hypothetical protein